MMKKGRLILGILCIVVALIGTVWIPYYNSHGFIQVSGIALRMKGETIAVEFELFEPDFENYLGKTKSIVQASGDSLENCIENLSHTYGKELFLRDAAVLIISERDLETLTPYVEEFFSKRENQHGNLPVFLWENPQENGFFGDQVNSLDIARSARMLKRTYTLTDWLNQKGNPVYIKGGEGYEISKMG